MFCQQRNKVDQPTDIEWSRSLCTSQPHASLVCSHPVIFNCSIDIPLRLNDKIKQFTLFTAKNINENIDYHRV